LSDEVLEDDVGGAQVEWSGAQEAEDESELASCRTAGVSGTIDETTDRPSDAESTCPLGIHQECEHPDDTSTQV